MKTPNIYFLNPLPSLGSDDHSPNSYKYFIQNTVLGKGTGGRWPGGKARLRDPCPGLHWGSSLTGGC